MPVHDPEQRPGVDLRYGEPLLDGPDGAARLIAAGGTPIFRPALSWSVLLRQTFTKFRPLRALVRDPRRLQQTEALANPAYGVAEQDLD